MSPVTSTSSATSGGSKRRFLRLFCCTPGSHPSLRRSVRRIVDFSPPAEETEEVIVLRETAARQKTAIRNLTFALEEERTSSATAVQNLNFELEEERSSSATAASETMAMILRLQCEKAAAEMEYRQFRRLVEQKMAHDGRRIAALEGLLSKRNNAGDAYEQRLLNFVLGAAGDPSPPER